MDNKITELNHLAVSIVIRKSAELDATFHRISTGGRRGLTGQSDESLADINNNLNHHLQIPLYCPPRAPIALQFSYTNSAQRTQLGQDFIQLLKLLENDAVDHDSLIQLLRYLL
jgi:hypothetical protein